MKIKYYATSTSESDDKKKVSRGDETTAPDEDSVETEHRHNLRRVQVLDDSLDQVQISRRRVVNLARQRCCFLAAAIVLLLVIIIQAVFLGENSKTMKSSQAAAFESGYGQKCGIGRGTMPPVTSPPGETIDLSVPCGCADCTSEIWNRPAGYPSHTCGDRITYLMDAFPVIYPNQLEACRQVAFEHPCECAGCNPARCNVPDEQFVLPAGWEPPDLSNAQSAKSGEAFHREDQLYCFPNPAQRKRFTMWNGMTLEVKEGVCGPGGNRFVRETVEVDGDILKLKYAAGKASEVRILLPEDQRPYSYGIYDFFVKSIEVKGNDGVVKSTELPKELVLGLFTWHAWEDYESHENWNHEVDIEISRWNCEENADGQFLVQPPGHPQMHRFFTGPDATLSPAGHHYSFDWQPGQIEWMTTAGGSQAFTLSTEETMYKADVDLIQCMPDDGGVEVRMNLWNMLGAQPPSVLNFDDVVEVQLQFSYQKSDIVAMNSGDICSKDCQCQTDSLCMNGRCTLAE